MAKISVDYGPSVNLFGAAQGAFSGVLGAGGKADLINAQIEAKNAYTRATLAKAGLDEQEMGARRDLGTAGYDLARVRAGQGTSNAPHAGQAAPVPIDVNDAQGRWMRASQILSTGAGDSATGLNKGLGGLGLAFGAPSNARTNFALTGGNPTDHTILGPMDTIGTQSQIAVGNAREAAKAQGDIEVARANVPNQIAIDQANVPNKIAIENAKQRTQLDLDPMKNPDSIIYELETKKHQQGGMLAPEEEAKLSLARRMKFPQTDISFEDKSTNQHVVIPRTGDRMGEIYPSTTPPPPTAAPAIVPPTGFVPQSRGGSPPPSMSAPPAIVGGAPPSAPSGMGAQPGDPPGTMRFGSPKPTAAPTDAQSHTYKYARAKLDAEATLQNFTQNTQIPSQMDAMIRAVQNSDMKAQQFWESLPDERSRAYFDAAYLFLIGTLRQESGAAIGMNEFAQRYPTLLPSAHATPEEIARKTNLRKSDIAGDFAMLPQHLQQEIDRHAARVGVKYHDEDLPYVPPYQPAAPTAPQGAPRGAPVITGVEEIFD